MSSEVAIRVENLSKCYHIYDKPRDRLLQMLMRGKEKYYREFWALKNVSFEINKGETVGIIGRNGSGKSTLLQLICGTLNSTSGYVQSDGRIAALLELGSGFNPEFTGRENVYMNAAVLGLSREEIDFRFEDIVAFADIGDYINQPVKSYSSGMVVRLAFAVAINVEPQILVVDEALSVGDELFQRKCFSRIEAIRNNGATILFVSHSGATIVELCDRALLLDSGDMLAEGTPKYIVGQYQKLLYAPQEKRIETRERIGTVKDQLCDALNRTGYVDFKEAESFFQEFYDPHLKPSSTIVYESNGAYIESPVVLTESGEKVNNLRRGKSYRYCYKVRFTRGVCNVRFGMLIKTISGIELGGGASAKSPDKSLTYVEAESMYQVEFRFCCKLNAGTYFLNAGVMGDVNDSLVFLHRVVDVAMFRVIEDSNGLSTGIVDFDCLSEIARVST